MSLAAAPGQAQMMVCTKADHETVLRGAERTEGLKPVFIGTFGKNLIKVILNKHGRYRILMVLPGGDTCILAMGDDWEEIPIALGEAL